MGKKAFRSNRRPSITSRPPAPSAAATASSSSEKATTANPKPEAATTTTTTPAEAEELRSHQRLLHIFASTFDPVLSSPGFNTSLQQVKQALFNRDFGAAFGKEQFLEVYAARWSPPRALCYSRVLEQISEAYLEPLVRLTKAESDPESAIADEEEEEEIDDEVEHGRVSPTLDQERQGQRRSSPAATLRMLAIGGGAAEIVAFGNYIHGADGAVAGDLTLLDTGPWGEVVRKLQAGLTATPVLSKYASVAARAANAPLIEPATRLHSSFVRQDVLALDREALSGLLGQTPLLVTLLFTLNELYTTGGVGKTTSFLRLLTSTIPHGSLLLVVDSPGSYSEAAVGKEAKKYPMQWLLDHTLIPTDNRKEEMEGCKWEKLESHDSVWFRLDDKKLRYPIELQDSRYQMHLYRAVPRSS